MNWTLAYGTLTLTSGLICLIMAVYLAPHGQQRAARQLMFVFASMAVWGVGYGMEFFSPTLELKLWWARLEYLGTGWLGILLYRFIATVTGRNTDLTWPGRLGISLFPAAVVLLVFTNDAHQLMWTGVHIHDSGPIRALVFDRGILFWAYVVVTYLLILKGTLLLVRDYRTSSPERRRQLRHLLAGIALPWLGNTIYVLPMGSLYGLDFSPFSFMVTGLMFAWNLTRVRFFNIMPLARQALMDSMADPVIILDPRHRILAANQAFCRHMVPQAPPIAGITTLAQACAPLDHINQGHDQGPGRGQLTLEDRQWDVRIWPLAPSDAAPLGRLITLRDITEEQRSQAYISGIINAMPSMLLGLTPDGILTHWNVHAQTLTGIAPDQATGRRLAELLPHLWNALEDLPRALEHRESRSWDKVALTLKQTPLTARVTLYPLCPDRPDMGAVIRIDDISQQVRMEEMLIQSEKMMSLGGLAAGMAHEINNPLAGLLQYLQVIDNRLSASLAVNHQTAKELGITLEQVTEYMARRNIFDIIKHAREQGGRIGNIVQDMLTFSRKDKTPFRPHALPRLMDQTLALLNKDHDLTRPGDREPAQIRWDSPSETADSHTVLCSAGKIQQVLFNILKNAIQAMAEGRTPHPRITLSLVEEAGLAGIRIQDNGPGMDAQVAKRIFDPFFTTKAQGEGTGLGLSVSYFIVTQDHGGELRVESRPNHGTAFTLLLPRANASTSSK